MQHDLDPLIDKHLRDWYRSFCRSFYMRERFTSNTLGELKGLEPGGHASRGYGRVNYLSTDEPNPMQEDLDTLYQNQEIIMSDYINWVSSRENGSKILNKKRIKELVKEAFNECQADFMLQYAPASTSKGGGNRNTPRRKKGNNANRNKGGKSGGGRSGGRQERAAALQAALRAPTPAARRC